jgi:hypothetical protein
LQYVNYSNITLKALSADDGIPPELENGEIEARINLPILAVPECGQCPNCTEKSVVPKLCEKRLEVREQLVAQEKARVVADKGKKGKKRKHDKVTQFPNPKKSKTAPSPPTSAPASVNAKKKATKMMKTANGQVKPRVTSQGNKRMSIPEEHFPDFCRRISANGTGQRMNLINKFSEENPTISVRQVTIRFGEVTTKDRPACIKAVENKDRKKKVGRAFTFYLRPRFYKYLPPDQRPDNWETYAEMDEKAWKEEQATRKRKEAVLSERAESVASLASDKIDSASNMSPSVGGSVVDGDGTDDEGDEQPAVKKRKVEEEPW